MIKKPLLWALVLIFGMVFLVRCEKVKDPTRIDVSVSSHKTGEWVINPQFDWDISFSEGLASVRIGDVYTGKYGFMDKTGKMVIDPQFDSAYPFSEGLAPVMIGDDKDRALWGYISR